MYVASRHDKPLRTFSYQTKPWVLLTLGPRSPLAAQRRHYGSDAKTARGKAVQHIMLSNSAAGRLFESELPLSSARGREHEVGAVQVGAFTNKTSFRNGLEGGAILHEYISQAEAPTYWEAYRRSATPALCSRSYPLLVTLEKHPAHRSERESCSWKVIERVRRRARRHLANFTPSSTKDGSYCGATQTQNRSPGESFRR